MPTVGSLHRISPAVVLRAVSTVVDGQVFPLGHPLDAFEPPGLFGRPPLHLTRRQANERVSLPDGRCGLLNDDVVEFALQCSSHWDSLGHFGVIEEGAAPFHGGYGQESLVPDAGPLGIDAFGGAIVTRGVLIDMVAESNEWLKDETRLTTADVSAALRRQGCELLPGDGVLLYTGFEHRYAAATSNEERKRLQELSAGLDGSTTEFWSQSQVGFLAADNLAVEALPIDFLLHEGMLKRIGVPLGELWALSALSDACRKDGRYEMLIASAPLNLRGAFGSPANAVAIR